MYKAEDMADFELKAALEGFRFDHRVATRGAADGQQPPHGGMPLLSLAGFTDFMAVEVAADPDLLLGGLNSALRHYGVCPGRGPVPRRVLPASCPPALRRRIDEATARCGSEATRKLDAHKVQKDLELVGQQNALDLIGNTRYYYR